MNKDVVDILIGDMLFDANGYDEVASSRERAIASFSDISAAGEMHDSESYLQTDCYGIKIVNPVQFNLTVECLSVGLTFRQIARIIIATKEQTEIASIGSINETYVCRYARFSCALSLQNISEMLMTPNFRAFSIYFDMSTHQGMTYLDIRLRLCWQGEILNFHIVSVPVFERHTGENIFNVSANFLDCICREWRKTLVGVATDAACSITGRIQGFETRFEQKELYGLIRIWCGGD